MSEFSTALYNLLGERLRQRRETLRISQSDLSDKTSIGRTSISNIESGRQKPPLSVLYQICNALDIDLHFILPTFSEVQDVYKDKNDYSKYYTRPDIDPKTQDKISSILKDFLK